MDALIPGIDPLYALGANINVNRVNGPKEVQQEFAAVFVAQIMKEVFKAQSSMFGDEGSLGMFSENLYNDIFLAKVSREIAESKAFGFDRLMSQGVTNKVVRMMQ